MPEISFTSLPRLQIIGDSCAIPRDGIPYEQTYFYMLKNNLFGKYDVINNSVAANNVRKITETIGSVARLYNPQIVILNYGIVDAYPRPYHRHFSAVVYLLSKIGVDFDRMLTKRKLYYKLADIFNFKIVPFKEFKSRTESLIEEFRHIGTKKIIFVGIVRPQKEISKSKIAEKEIEKYNGVFKQFADGKKIFYVDMTSIDKESFIWDGYHYNEKASQYLTEQILKVINLQ